jgi:hypothetical protein
MSAPLLRENVRLQLVRARDEEVTFLVDRIHDTIDEIRVRQGRIAGYQTAIDILDATYRELNR